MNVTAQNVLHSVCLILFSFVIIIIVMMKHLLPSEKPHLTSTFQTILKSMAFTKGLRCEKYRRMSFSHLAGFFPLKPSSLYICLLHWQL